MKFYCILLLCWGLALPPAWSWQWVTLKYRSGDWYNSRQGVETLLREISLRTTVEVQTDILELDLEDIRIFEQPFLFLNGHVPLSMGAREKENFRRYVQSGGFVFINDDYGMDESVRTLLSEIFPGQPLTALPFDHELYHCFYSFPQGLPKIHEHDGGAPRGLGIFVNGRLSVYYSANTDIADGWDPPAVHNDPPEIREKALRMGVNIIVYALSH